MNKCKYYNKEKMTGVIPIKGYVQAHTLRIFNIITNYRYKGSKIE